MAAASGYKLLKIILEPGGLSMLKDNLTTLLIGNIVAFIVASIAIKTFITFLQKHGFRIFGWYRIVVGLVLIILLLMGADLKLG
jgi:undecaprenyl-diphosphatase